MIIPNKVLILITIFIVICVIVAICISLNRESFSESGAELHYYSLSTCPHCLEFDPVWKQFEKKTKRCYKYVVDEDEVAHKKAEQYNITSYPTIIVVKNNKPVEELNDRTCGAMRKMCKKHGIPCTVVC